jgi:hypothetical protein
MNKRKKNSDWTNEFEVFVDSDLIKVSVQNVAIDFPEIDLPDFDSIAIVIHEATQNVRSVRPPAPPMTVGNKNYNYEYNTAVPKKKGRTDVNLDSLMQIKNKQNNKIRIEKNDKIESDSQDNSIQFFYNDSLILMQNEELKKEMDKLRRELQQFRYDLTKPGEIDSGQSKKSRQQVKPVDLDEIEI